MIEQNERFNVTGLIGLADEVGTDILGYPVLGTDEDLPSLIKNRISAIVSIGQIKTPEQRIRLFQLLKENDCELPVIISPRAYVSKHAVIGEGSIIMHGAIVNAGAVIGRNCIVNSHALVEHDSVIADHCHISTMSAINSTVHVGTGSFIGSGSTVRQNTKIGEYCLIGMGQRVIKDCDDHTCIPPKKCR